MRKIFIDYSNNQTIIEPIQNIGSIKITIEETYDGKSAKNSSSFNKRLVLVFNLLQQQQVQPQISTTTPSIIYIAKIFLFIYYFFFYYQLLVII